MNIHRIAASTLFACFSLSAIEVHADVVASVIIDSPTSMSVALDGALSGVAPSQFANFISIDFGSSNIPSGFLSPIAISGGYNVSAANGNLFNNIHSAADSINLFLGSVSPLTPGALVTGQATFEYGVPHQIQAGQDFTVWWGGSAPAVGGALQSRGTTAVPEPASMVLAIVAALGGICRRR